MLAQVPVEAPVFATTHAWQTPLQPVLQQTPSVHTPLEHCEFVVHAVPFGNVVQCPEPSQVVAPAHSASGSVDPPTAKHVPPGPPVFVAEHATHVPMQLVLQQLPSTQLPLVHWVPLPQATPLARVEQVPAPAHTDDAGHSLSGSVPGVTAAQVPFGCPVFAFVHATHEPLHAVEQQTPSEQIRLSHCDPAAHAAPGSPQTPPSLFEPSQSSSMGLQLSVPGNTVCEQTSVPPVQLREPVPHAPWRPVEHAPAPGFPSSVKPSQSSSAPLQDSLVEAVFCVQAIAPEEQVVVPAAHAPGWPVVHAEPLPGLPSSTVPSQSLSAPSQTSADAFWFDVHCRLPAVQVSEPAVHAPSNPVLHGAPPPGFPSSTAPSQSLSTPSQASAALGLMAATASLQSPSHVVHRSSSSSGHALSVVVVVASGRTAGAQMSFADLTVIGWVPNWSVIDVSGWFFSQTTL
jgi:hypothetical protein